MSPGAMDNKTLRAEIEACTVRLIALRDEERKRAEIEARMVMNRQRILSSDDELTPEGEAMLREHAQYFRTLGLTKTAEIIEQHTWNFDRLELTNVADLINPETGNTYRQDNLARSHKISVGALVELESGIRLHVVAQTRDCDGEPLYSLGILRDEEEGWEDEMDDDEENGQRQWKNGDKPESDLAIVSSNFDEEGRFRLRAVKMFHGYREESLRMVEKGR